MSFDPLIMDPQGHRVAALHGDGREIVRVGRDSSGRPLPLGAYFAHVRSLSGTAGARLVRVR